VYIRGQDELERFQREKETATAASGGA
jgi:hypothetical protein